MNDELTHYGVLGMKWGVRKDGKKGSSHRAKRTLSKNQKKAIAKGTVGVGLGVAAVKSGNTDANTFNVARNQIKTARDYITNKETNEKKAEARAKARKMTDEELRNHVNRMNLEKQYVILYAETKTVDNGKAYVNDILEVAGAAVTIAGSAVAVATAINKVKKVGVNQNGIIKHGRSEILWTIPGLRVERGNPGMSEHLNADESYRRIDC